VTEYVWDYRNRLSGVLFKDALGVVTKTIEYLYDVDDRRIGKKIDGTVTERYVYDGLHIALAFDGAGSQTHRYLYGTEVDQILASETPTRVLWALTDRLGSVKDLVDENGVVLNHINYDSFGRVVSQTDASVEFRYGYTGREQDAETGLDYYRARYYDPTVGEFISEDPIGFRAGDTNLTRYVGNNPTNFVDPSGLQEDSPIGSIVGSIAEGLIGAFTKLFSHVDPLPTKHDSQPLNPDDRKPHPVNPTPAIPRAGYCNDEPPPDCEPDPGKEVAEQITQEILDQLKTEAIGINKAGGKIQKNWDKNNKVAIGISESGKKYIATTNGTYPTGEKFKSGDFQAELRNKGYIVVKTDGLGEVELYENGPNKGKPKKWHAEGRLLQNGINIGDRIVGIGTSDDNCRDCAADIKKYNIKTADRVYSVKDYDNFPGKRPDWRKKPKKKKC
jgi:RHS repeat-associated protein